MTRCVLLLAVAVVVAGCGGTRRAPYFQTAAGWHVLVEPGQTASAANVAFARSDRSQSFPTRTIASLPPRGVLIWIEWVRPRTSATDAGLYRQLSLPLRVSQTHASGAPSGVPEGTSCPSAAPDCALGQVSAMESGWDATVWIFSGAPRKSPAQIAAANSELARLSFG
jgi:hypothetical protein